jgi:hypothetical protein
LLQPASSPVLEPVFVVVPVVPRLVPVVPPACCIWLASAIQLLRSPNAPHGLLAVGTVGTVGTGLVTTGVPGVWLNLFWYSMAVAIRAAAMSLIWPNIPSADPLDLSMFLVTVPSVSWAP